LNNKIFSNFSIIASWRGSRGSKNREYYYKNNDTRKMFFRGILEKIWEKNDEEMIRNIITNRQRNKKGNCVRRTKKKSTDENRKKKFGERSKINRESGKLKKQRIKNREGIALKEVKKDEKCRFFLKKNMKSKIKIRSMHWKKNQEEEERNREECERIELKGKTKKKKKRKKNMLKTTI